jgi:transcription elongation factor Elf1
MINRVKKTFNKKYGIDYYPQHKSFAQKVKDTKFLHYGNANFSNPEKGIQTKIEKYGDKNNFKKYIQTCLDKYGVHNYSLSNEFKKTVDDNYANIYPDLDFKEVNKLDVKLYCKICNQDFVIDKHLLYGRSKVGSVICVNCNKIGHSSISSLENQINDYIKSLGIETIQAYRVKGNKEIDIFLPTQNIGIEFNGLLSYIPFMLFS